MIQVRAQLKHLRMSPKKVRLVADTIKGLEVNQALVRLGFTHKAAAPHIAKVLRSAIANAVHNNNLAADSLMVKKIIVNEAVALKRWKPPGGRWVCPEWEVGSWFVGSGEVD